MSTNATTQQPAYTDLTDDQKMKLNFLTGLFPDGRDLKDIISEVQKEYDMTPQLAETHSKGLLKTYVEEEKTVQVIKRRNGTIKVLLTKKGRETIFLFLEKMRKGNPEKYVNYLKDWMKRGNQIAMKMYYNECVKVIREKPEISCLLMGGKYEDDVIEQYSKIIGKTNDANLKSEVIRYMGLLTTLKIARLKRFKENGVTKSAYGLRPDGIKVVRIMLSGSQQAPEQKIVASKLHVPMYKKPPFIFILSTLLSFIFISLLSPNPMIVALMCGASLIAISTVALVMHFFPFMLKLITKGKN